MAYIQTIETNVSASPSSDKATVRLSQNENGRQLYFRILGIEIPEGSTATISGTKPDGVVYSKAGTVDGFDYVVFEEDVQMTAVAGKWGAKIHIINDGHVIATALLTFNIEQDPVDAGAIPSDSQLDGIIAEVQAYEEKTERLAKGLPFFAGTASEMTDETRVYVYGGTETGYTPGHWYYYDGEEWTDGGAYVSGIQIDTSLSVQGAAADAKAVGDAVESVRVTDGSLTESKFSDALKLKTIKDYVTPQMFGAKADGETDDTQAIQSAIDYCETDGGVVFFPCGKYVITALTLKKGVNISGVHTQSRTLSTGSVFYCTDSQSPALTIKGNNEVSGVAFYYPDFVLENGEPNIEYPASVYIANGCFNSRIHDIVFYNSYIGIKSEYSNGPNTVDHVSGYCVYNFVDIDGAYDVFSVHDCHIIYTQIWDLMPATDYRALGTWTRNNGIAFKIGDAAWSNIKSCFAFGYHTGVLFYQSQTGPYDAYNTKFDSCGFDACGIAVNATTGANNTFVNCVFSTGKGGLDEAELPDYGVIIEDAFTMTFNACTFSGFQKGSFYIDANYLNVNNCLFNGWNGSFDSTNVTYLMNIVRGIINISGNVFYAGNSSDAKGFNVASTATLVSVSDNIFSQFTVPVLTGDNTKVKSSGNQYHGTTDANKMQDEYKTWISSSVLTPSNPVTIPSEFIDNYKLLVIGLRRSGYYGSVVLDKTLITDNALSNGISILDGTNGSAFWKIYIETDGTVKLLSASTSSLEPFVVVYGLVNA